MTPKTDWPVFDGHNDCLLSLYLPKEGEERSFFTRSPHGHIDLPRMREGGLGGWAVMARPLSGSGKWARSCGLATARGPGSGGRATKARR